METATHRMPASPQNALEFREQEYWCRNCEETTTSRGIPEGWFIVRKSHGMMENLKTVSIVCSLPCLALDTVKAVNARLKERY